MSRIKTKNSTNAASVPANGSLLQGEVAINIADKKLYVGNASGNPIEITSQGVTTVTGTPSGVYVTQATGSTTIGLQTNIFVSGSLSASGLVVGDIAVNDGTISTTATGVSIFDATAARINIGAGASGVKIGNATGVVVVGDIAVNNGAITTTAATATLFNASATTVNIGGAAATMNVGTTGCTLVLRGSINATGSIFNNGTISTTGHITAASGYRITSAAINAQTATGYTLVATDNGRIITFDSAATHTLRIPTGLDIGFNSTIIQLGTGQVTCTGLSGATVNCYASGNKILGQHGSASVICYASNVYNLAGTLGI